MESKEKVCIIICESVTKQRITNYKYENKGGGREELKVRKRTNHTCCWP